MSALYEAATDWVDADPFAVRLTQRDEEPLLDRGPTHTVTHHCTSAADLALFNFAYWTNRFIANQLKLFQLQHPWLMLDENGVFGKATEVSMGTTIPGQYSRVDGVSCLFDEQNRLRPNAQTNAMELWQLPLDPLVSSNIHAWAQPRPSWSQAVSLPIGLARPSDVISLDVTPLAPPPPYHKYNESPMGSMMTSLDEPWELPDEAAGGDLILAPLAEANTDLYHITWEPSATAEIPLWAERRPSVASGLGASVSVDLCQDLTSPNTVVATVLERATDHGLTENPQQEEDAEQGAHEEPVRAVVDGEVTLCQVLEGMAKPSKRRPVSDPTTGMSYRPACKPCYEWMSKGSGCNWADLPSRDPTQSCDRCIFYGVDCDKTVLPSRKSRRVASGRRPKRLPVRASDGTIYSCVCRGCTGGRYAGICDWTDRARVDGVLDVNKSCSPCASWGIDCHKKPWKSTKVG